MIQLEKVTQRYGCQTVLDGFSHVFARGSLTAISGPSGTGKTTLLQVIAGLIPIAAGQVAINGQVTDTPALAVHPSRRQLGFVFQFPALWPHLTVRQNILYGLAKLPRQDQEARLADILETLAITDLQQKRPAELSGGQARRVSLARTLVVRPQHLLLDEPLNNLDPQLKDQVVRVLAEYREKQQATVVWVTHDPGEVAGIQPELRVFGASGLAFADR